MLNVIDISLNTLNRAALLFLGLLILDQAKDKDALVVCLEENKALFAENDFVTFEGVKNLEKLNGCKPVPIEEVIGKWIFNYLLNMSH